MKLDNLLWCLAASFSFYTASAGNDARQHHVSTKINFKLPEVLKFKGNGNEKDLMPSYEHTDALFGVPFVKDRSITGLTYYMTPPTESTKDKPGCDPSKYPVTYPEGDNGIKGGNQVFLLDRGGCTFSEKVKIAQAQGAEAVIIANNECLQSDYEKLKVKIGEGNAKKMCCDALRNKQDQNRCNGDTVAKFPEYLPFMASNGDKSSDRSITIPAIMMTLMDSLKIKSVLCCPGVQSSLSEDAIKFCQNLDSQGLNLLAPNNKDCTDANMVMAHMKLDTPHPDGHVEYQVWMKADDPPEFLETFEWFSQAMRKKAMFTPKYIVIDGSNYKCDTSGTNSCGSFCLNDGKYCAIPESQFITGVDVLHEILRQYCIWKVDSEDFDNKGLPKWWAYQKGFRELNCKYKTSSEDFKKCSDEVLHKVHYSSKYLECVNEKNWETHLADMSKEQADYAIFTTAMIVNTRVMHFSMTTPSLAHVICDGFSDGTAPQDICPCVEQAVTGNDFAQCKTCYDSGDCKGGVSTVTKVTGVSYATVSFLVLGVAGFFTLGAVLYNRHQSKRMRDDVRNILAEYMPLEEVNPTAGMSFTNGVPMGSSQNVNSLDREDANLI